MVTRRHQRYEYLRVFVYHVSRQSTLGMDSISGRCGAWADTHVMEGDRGAGRRPRARGPEAGSPCGYPLGAVQRAPCGLPQPPGARPKLSSVAQQSLTATPRPVGQELGQGAAEWRVSVRWAWGLPWGLEVGKDPSEPALTGRPSMQDHQRWPLRAAWATSRGGPLQSRDSTERARQTPSAITA